MAATAPAVAYTVQEVDRNVERMLERVAGITPKGLLEAMEDPSVVQKTATGDLYIQLGVMRKFASSQAMTIQQRLQYMNLLSKISGVQGYDEKPLNAANLPQIVINVPDYSQIPKPRLVPIGRQVIEHGPPVPVPAAPKSLPLAKGPQTAQDAPVVATPDIPPDEPEDPEEAALRRSIDALLAEQWPS